MNNRNLTPVYNDRVCELRSLVAFWKRQATVYAELGIASAKVCKEEWATADIELSLELGKVEP